MKTMSIARASTASIIASIRHDLANLSTSGVTAVRDVRRHYAKTLSRHSPQTIIAVADGLFAARDWPERLVASELVAGRTR